MQREVFTSLLKILLESENSRTSKQLALISNAEKCNIKGSLKTMKKRNRYYYVLQHYDSLKKKFVCTYIRVADVDIAKKVANRDYLRDVEKVLRAKKQAIEQLLNNDYDALIDDCYGKLDDGRKAIVTPLEESVQARINEWNNAVYLPNNSYPETLIHPTERGEMVRSKSEAWIADYLYSQREFLDYRYEKPLQVVMDKKIVTIHPDFTIINLRTGEIYILEHASRLDLPEYHNAFVWKHRAYTENGWTQSGRLFYSFESEGLPFNIKQVKDIVKNNILK